MDGQPQGRTSLTARAFWLMCAKTLAFASSFALPLLLVRRLDQTQFGLYKQAFLVIGSAIAVLPLGFGMSAFYFLPRQTESRRKAQVILNILLFNIIVGLLACLLLVWRPDLLGKVFREPQLASYGPLIGCVIFFWIFSSFLELVAVANEETKLSTIFIVGAQFSKALFMLAAAVFLGTIRSMLYAALFHSILQSFILLLYLSSRFPKFWQVFDWGMLRHQVSYALPFGFAGLLYTLQMDLHSYFISNRYEAAVYAVYAVGCFQLPLVAILSESIVSVMIPRISFLQKQNNSREIVFLMARVIRKLAFIYFPLYAFLMITGRELITWLFTENYIDSWPIFAINLTLLPFYAILLDPIARAYSDQRFFLLRLRTILLIVLVTALWFTVDRFGPIGVISVVVMVNLTQHLIVTHRWSKVIGFTRSDLGLLSDVGLLVLATVIASVPTIFTKPFLMELRPVFLIGALGGVFFFCYVSAILLMKIPNTEERELFRRKALKVWRLIPGRGAAESSV